MKRILRKQKIRTRLALLVCVAGVSGHAQPPGTYTPTSNMNVARSGHTATLLQNGKVLTAGGSNGNAASGLLTLPDQCGAL
jgi:hypothetical protein